jgi:DNA repair exonuclease SbcCD ATPase subunit
MTELSDLALQVRQARRMLDRQAGEARAIGLAGQRAQAELRQHRDEVDTFDRAAAVLTSIGEKRQESVQYQIETLVTQGLQTIFSDDLSFHVVSSIKGKVPVVDFIVRTTFPDGRMIDTPVMDARGGGLAVVVGFLLRLVVLLLSKDKCAQVLFLDETFAMVSKEYLPKVASFLRELVDKSEIQVVLVTHSNELTENADIVYRLMQDSDGCTNAVTV